MHKSQKHHPATSQEKGAIMAKQVHQPEPQHSPIPPSKRPKQELVKQELMGVITADLAALAMEDEGVGRETMGAKDLAIPRISVLQALSPVCTKGDPAYIKEAEVGEFFDNIESKRWSGDDGIVVIPVTYRRTLLEWKPRTLGGGFVADHGLDESCLKDAVRNEKGQDILPNGNEIIQTAEYFCIMIDPNSGLPKQVVLSMAKTQFKKAKIWNSMMSNLMVPRPDGKGVFNPAIFYQSYKITTVPESNDKGSWYGWHIESYKPTFDLIGGADLYLGGRNFRKAVNAGEVKVAEPVAAEFTGTTIEGEDEEI
jgi:hypothetical protein